MMGRLIGAAVALLTFVGGAAAQERASPAEAQVMAEAAADLLATAELDDAIAAFNTAPEWRERDLYVFAVGSDGITLAHGGDPAQIGRDVTVLTDADGVEFGKAFLAVEDRAWVHYVYRNPTNGLDEPKQTYVIRVGELIVGVGAYVPIEERATLEEAQAMAEAAAAFLDANGPDVAFPAFNDGADWHDRDLYVFVFDLVGINLSHGANATLIGQDLTGLVDPNGVYFVRDFLEVEDAAWVPYVYTNPLTGLDEPKQSYVIRTGGYILGVGAYVP